jgi:hypothetical protein
MIVNAEIASLETKLATVRIMIHAMIDGTPYRENEVV